MKLEKMNRLSFYAGLASQWIEEMKYINSYIIYSEKWEVRIAFKLLPWVGHFYKRNVIA